MMGTIPAPRVDVPTEGTTSEFYRTVNLPPRFDHPDWFQGYGSQRDPPRHPCYYTTSLDYGWYAPSVHTVPTAFFPLTSEFTLPLSRAGMYRNYSLNTAPDRCHHGTC
ncbi:piercer of microtubule wall 1 protein [Bacillus rossius redtenbacheri]|uniref:piercer of microtubule wall 1 protein n=1 Tax=Bacillus rossius redtenbacheri TaxID=93214 RepID=UPI002FDE8391